LPLAKSRFDKTVPTKVAIPDRSLDTHITSGKGKYALARTRLCIKISHDKPAARNADPLTSIDLAMNGYKASIKSPYKTFVFSA
jgi:hypothetical protein